MAKIKVFSLFLEEKSSDFVDFQYWSPFLLCLTTGPRKMANLNIFCLISRIDVVNTCKKRFSLPFSWVTLFPFLSVFHIFHPLLYMRVLLLDCLFLSRFGPVNVDIYGNMWSCFKVISFWLHNQAIVFCNTLFGIFHLTCRVLTLYLSF